MPTSDVTVDSSVHIINVYACHGMNNFMTWKIEWYIFIQLPTPMTTDWMVKWLEPRFSNSGSDPKFGPEIKTDGSRVHLGVAEVDELGDEFASCVRKKQPWQMNQHCENICNHSELFNAIYHEVLGVCGQIHTSYWESLPNVWYILLALEFEMLLNGKWQNITPLVSKQTSFFQKA